MRATGKAQAQVTTSASSPTSALERTICGYSGTVGAASKLVLMIAIAVSLLCLPQTAVAACTQEIRTTGTGQPLFCTTCCNSQGACTTYCV